MAAMDHAAILSVIRDQQADQPLSILNLAEPILSNIQQIGSQVNTDDHDMSTSANESSTHDAHLTPAALSADLEHYKSLFSKLRFSYLEQVTKEKYLRSIVGDPPILVSHEDNMALEQKLVGMKSELKAKKEDVARLVDEMETLATALAQKYETVNTEVAEVKRLPIENEQLREKVAELNATLKEKQAEMDVDISDDPRMNLGLEETQAALEERKRRIQEVDDQIAALQRDMPGKMRECERAERELEELETKKNEVTRQARELQRLRQEGGRDMLEEQGRWYKSSEILLNGLLEIKT